MWMQCQWCLSVKLPKLCKFPLCPMWKTKSVEISLIWDLFGMLDSSASVFEVFLCFSVISMIRPIFLMWSCWIRFKTTKKCAFLSQSVHDNERCLSFFLRTWCPYLNVTQEITSSTSFFSKSVDLNSQCFNKISASLLSHVSSRFS